MSYQSPQADNNSVKLSPPSGDPRQADDYIAQLVKLVNSDKLTVSHTDLAKFDPSSLQDHYCLELKDYKVEISHSKQPNSGKDFYIILFNNLKSVSEKCTEKIILAYIHLSVDQFKRFKSVADAQLDRKRKEEEQKRFKEAMAPIDQALEQLASSNPQTLEEETDHILNNNVAPAFMASA